MRSGPACETKRAQPTCDDVLSLGGGALLPVARPAASSINDGAAAQHSRRERKSAVRRTRPPARWKAARARGRARSSAARAAYLLLGVNPDFRVNVYQMAPIGKLQYTVGAELFKTCLPVPA